jgi:hypothetical protein
VCATETGRRQGGKDVTWQRSEGGKRQAAAQRSKHLGPVALAKAQQLVICYGAVSTSVLTQFRQ